MSNELKIIAKNGILVSSSIVGTSFYLLSYTFHGYNATPIIWQFMGYFNTLFFKTCGTQVCLLGVA
jgi:hypothetical protein